MKIQLLTCIVWGAYVAARAVYVHDNDPCGVSYKGSESDGVEHFYGIPYGQDTSGENRFKPPRLYVPAPGSEIDASKPGVACPQPLGITSPPLGQGNITAVSEDCLNLNVVRPKFENADSYQKLPVMVWIHGGEYPCTSTVT